MHHLHATSPTISAPGKLILCGEHAVVYGRPAIALPVYGIRARAEAIPTAPGSGIAFDALDLGRSWQLDMVPDDPLSQLAATVVAQLGQPMPDLQIRITSDIPIASGMGSGAAIATVVVRVLAQALEVQLSPAEVSTLVYESEKRYHGTPSGIDNTVVAFEQPIWFVRGGVEQKNKGTEEQKSNAPFLANQPTGPTIIPIRIASPFTLVIGDTGVRSATKLPVAEVRRRWEEESERYEQLFDDIAACVGQVRDVLAQGDIAPIGTLLNENQRLLQAIGVSSPELERLVVAARNAGALGAKLSGAGWGGVMIALVESLNLQRVQRALVTAGAVRVLITRIEQN